MTALQFPVTLLFCFQSDLDRPFWRAQHRK